MFTATLLFNLLLFKERKKKKNYTHNFCLQLNCITEYISYENIILGNKFWYLNE